MGGTMKRASTLVLGVALVALTIGSCGVLEAQPVPRGDSQARADRKANRRQQKAQKKYAKQQKKAEKKMLKMERKNTHYPKQVF
jgi:sRNA-binding protein